MFSGRNGRSSRVSVTAKRHGRAWVLAFAVAGSSGCYVYTPAPVTPSAGTQLLLELSDRGRVGLGDSIGPAAVAIEGTTVSSSDSAYALRVSRVSYLNGQSNRWMGEPLVVSRNFVARAREQKFSKGRTWLTAGGVSAVVVLFIATRGLRAFGNSSQEPGGGNPSPE